MTVTNPISSLDIFPTVVALTGITPPAGLDGVNLTPYLKGEKTEPPHDALFFSIDGKKAVRQNEWKLVVEPDETPHLFNLVNDLEEQHDLAANEPARVEELTRKWNVWHAQMPAAAKVKSNNAE